MKVIEAGVPERDWVQLSLDISSGNVRSVAIECVGCLTFLKAVHALREKLGAAIGTPLDEVPPPAGDGHESLILRELIWKAQEKWELPFKEPMLCKCRGVSTEKVVRAIEFGCRTPEEIGRYFSAGTGCGTCRPHQLAVINYLTSYPKRQAG